MTKNPIIMGLLILMLSSCLFAFPACSTDGDLDEDENEQQVATDDEADLVTNSTFSKQVTINFGSSVAISNPYESAGVSVSYEGNYVTVTSTAEDVEYVLSGTTTAGCFKIYSDNKFMLTLDGVSITSGKGAAINVQSHKRVFVNLPSGTSSKLVDASSYQTDSSEDQKGAFFSEGQLIFNGTGALSITGNYKHALCSDDYVRIYEGNITLKSTVSDGIHTSDAFEMDGGTLNITSATDAIDCDEGYVVINGGNITISSGDDGITTSYEGTDSSINPYMNIKGGTINITTTGLSAKGIKSFGDLTIDDGTITVTTSHQEAEGIESKTKIEINGGNITVNAYDDGINAAKDITITGGKIYSYSTTNDAIDSNGTMTISGGTIFAIGAGTPEDGLDCDQNTINITGGTIIGVGGGTSSPSTSSKQNSLVYGGSGTINTLFHIANASGTDILTFKIPRTLSQMTIVYSGANLASNTNYTIYTGGSVSGGTDFHGLYTGATYSGGTQASTFTTSSTVTTVGSTSGMGGGGGTPGGWR